MAVLLKDVVPDINALLSGVVAGTTHEVSDEDLAKLGTAIAIKVRDALKARVSGRTKGKLYVSDLGKPCKRQLWYTYNSSNVSEPLSPSNKIKFLFGEIVEELVLFLVKQAGHEVTNEQTRVSKTLENGWIVSGMMDCIIDGVMVDIKSSSSFSFKKFKDKTLAKDDAFGYIEQVTTYDALGPQADMHGLSTPAFLAMDKQMGTLAMMQLTMQESMDGTARGIDSAEKTTNIIDMITPPARHFEPVPISKTDKSGNLKLGTNCSYCNHKHECWSDANIGMGLRTFLYSNKPVFMVEVNKLPRVQEITK